MTIVEEVGKCIPGSFTGVDRVIQWNYMKTMYDGSIPLKSVTT